MSLKSKKAACPNHLLRQERQRRNWTLEEAASELHLLCEENARTARGEINAKMIGSWERGEHAPSLYYRRKLCLLFGKSAEELGFVEPLQPPEPHPAVLSEMPRGAPLPSAHHQTMDMHDASDAPYASLEQQTSAYLTSGASDLALLVEAGWSVDDILDSLRVILPGVQAMQKITRRKVWELGTAAVMSDIPILTGRHISAEERVELHNVLGESIAAGWKLFHTGGNVQVLAIARAQLFLVQQNHILLYPNVQSLFYSAAYRLMGAALHFQGRYEQAYRAHEKAYISALEGADAWNMAQSRSWQAYGLKACGNYSSALHAADAALRLVSPQTDTESIRLRARLLAFSAENAALLDDREEVQTRLSASEALLEYLPDYHEEFDRVSWLQEAGVCALSLRQYETAAIQLRQALDELPAQWTLRSISTVIPLVRALTHLSELDEALAIARKTLPIVKLLQSAALTQEFTRCLHAELLRSFPNDRRCQAFVVEVHQQLA